MKFFVVFWGLLLLSALAGFLFMALAVAVKGFGELKDIFRRLGTPNDKKEEEG